MRQDDILGATGEWIALLGFSQGAKVSASLLYRQQVREELLGKDRAGTNFRFGILIAGRGPFVSLDSDLILSPPLPDASQITDYKNAGRKTNSHVLRIPTLHVHGLRDEGIGLHRQLFRDLCDEGSRTLIEWDGNHRLPLKFKDVSLVVNQIRELTKETGLC
jgi:predicted esterase